MLLGSTLAVPNEVASYQLVACQVSVATVATRVDLLSSRIVWGKRGSLLT